MCRMRESDSGARLLVLIYKKYVCELGWKLQWSTGHLVPSAECMNSLEAQIVFLKSLCTWLNDNITKGESLTPVLLLSMNHCCMTQLFEAPEVIGSVHP